MSNGQIQDTPSTPNKVSQMLQSLIHKFKLSSAFKLMVSLALLTVVSTYFYFTIFNNKAVVQNANFLINSLVVVDAQIDNMTSPSSVTITFNQPVDLHEFSHYFSLTPKVSGRLIDSRNKRIITYKFDKKYRGPNLNILIESGLTSINNAALLDTYIKTFDLNLGQRYQQYSQVKSYPAGEDIPIYTDINKINIYKSNAHNLLSFLKYSLRENETRGSIYSGEFTEKFIKHNESDRLKNVRSDDNFISLNPGVYYIENDGNAPYFVVVSDYGILLRQDDKHVLIGAFNLKDGRMINDPITIGLYNLKGGVNLIKDFKYTSSEYIVPLSYPIRLDAVIGIYNNQVVFLPVEVPNSLADIQVSSNLDNDTQIFLYTDRPIYKPGDKVFVRGVVRQDSDSAYRVPESGKLVYLKMLYGNNQEELQTVNLDEYGTFNAFFTLPEDFESEYTTLMASMEEFKSGNFKIRSLSFEVKKFIKPDFEIKTSVVQPEYLHSDKIKFNISGNYFDGQPLANKEVEYMIYSDNYYEVEKAVYNKNFNITSPGGMCGGGGFQDWYGNEYKKGKVTLNSNGQAVVETNADEKLLLSQKVTLLAQATDNSQNKIVSAVNTIVHAAEFNIFFIPSADRYSPGDEAVVPFYSETLTGEKVRNKKFDYKLINTEYKSDGTNEQSVLTEGDVETDDNGKGIVKFKIPKNDLKGSKQLVVSGLDSKNNTVQNQKYFYVLTKEDEESNYQYWGRSISQTYLKITSNQNTFKVGDTVSLNIESPKDLDVLLTYERGRIYNPRFLHLSKGSNNLQFRVDEKMSPSITVVFSYFSNGNYYSEGIALNMPAMHKLLNISLAADKQVYSPNENAELTITTRDANGTPVAAQMSIGIVDKAIYALRKSATPPIHSSFYYFRPRSTNASSSLTGLGLFGGGGGGGGGGGLAGKNADVLYWDPNLKTDATGEVRVTVPLLGFQTIWKVQVIGSTISTQVGQADTEFTVTSNVQGVSTQRNFKDRLLEFFKR